MQKGDTFIQKFKITPYIYEGFIAISNDKNPLHTNHDFAVSKGFQSKVMHGNILGGFVSFFVGELLPIDNVIIHSQELKFYNPVYLNDNLDFSAEVIGIYESVNTIEFKFTFSKDSTKIAKGKVQIGII